jgi:hypothetical protein
VTQRVRRCPRRLPCNRSRTNSDCRSSPRPPHGARDSHRTGPPAGHVRRETPTRRNAVRCRPLRLPTGTHRGRHRGSRAHRPRTSSPIADTYVRAPKSPAVRGPTTPGSREPLWAGA